MQRQKPQAISPDIQAIAKALRKKEGGADEALRLVEHLQDKDALELLITGAELDLKRLTPFLFFVFGLVFLSVIAWVGLLFVTISRRHLSFDNQVALLLLMFCPMFLAFLLSQLFPQVGKNLEAALSEYVPQVHQATAVEPLLHYLNRPFLSTEIRRKCWEAVRPLLSRFSDDEARALSPESCDFLHRLVATGDKRLPALSSSDKIAVLLVLAARREDRTRHLLEAQRAYPDLREAAQNILEEW
jgi:hypothetical protein